MEEAYLIKTFCDTVTYKCPHCGKVNKFSKSTIELFRENEIDYIYCEECDRKITL